MTISDTISIVAKQYTEYCYPTPVADMAEAITKNAYYEFASPALFWPILYPEGRCFTGLRVLIAGCGTNQAAYNAITLPNAQITAIDLSMTSLQHSQYLKQKHSLKNLSLHHMNLLDVRELGQQFDLIICTGVLHHLPDPEEGLRALKGVLATDGVMSLMLYGRYARVGVYMLQQAFKLLGCQQQTAEDVELVKATLATLNPEHAVHSYVQKASDLKYDAGLVDTFLHPQDCAYSVLDVMNFAQNNGLAFWDWVDRLDYSASAAIPAEHPIHARLKALNPVAQWAVVELLTQAHGTHRFFLSHPERANTARRIRFDTDDWLDWIPTLRQPIQVLQKTAPQNGSPAKLKRSWHEFFVAIEVGPLLEQVNGTATIREIIARVQSNRLHPEMARGFFAQMHGWGHLMYSLVPFELPQQ